MKSFFRGLLNDALEPISAEVSRLSVEFDRRDAALPSQWEERVEYSLDRWIPPSRTSAAVAEKKERIASVFLFVPGALQAQKVRKPFNAVAFFSDKDPSPSHSNLSDVSGSSDASFRHSAAQRVVFIRRKKRSSKQSKKVHLTACPKFAGKKEIVDFVSQWGDSEFSNMHLQKKHFRSTEEWRFNIIIALNKAESDARAFKRDVRR
uniref:Uncharacterized protein n=1 Tax=Chromera velia CCMP2878 TaxID=1169474 RepID=A0A0G4FSK2_9ALVE|eukprot:Cvel_18459.t1-p1 / transcript=Cvel_18459.t1 / gene=Cvel_18459 / organism=Chromera_velia_CCMP2878 / gene_product=hypothetical protein / transcript_product=hypothetical protein / location=Cvel_scaffold1529:33743-34357(+) / protein_length=205 / sequence_SO=supercontig / SO=protein_coding / is_pseudo=false